MKKRFTEEQILQVLGEARAGLSAAEVCRKYGISQVTFYKWRNKFGSMSISEAKRLRELTIIDQKANCGSSSVTKYKKRAVKGILF